MRDVNFTKQDKIFSIFIYSILAVFSFICLYPFIYILSASFSSGHSVQQGEVFFLPHDFNLASYFQVIFEPSIWIAYANTLYYTVVGVGVNLMFTIFGAYPLSKKRIKGRSFIAFFIALTMWFNAGMIPMYLNFRDLDLLDTRTAIIVGFAITTFLVFILRTFFQSLPDSLEESAQIDGANDLQILWKIYLPLSKPALITVGLFYAVERWNGYFWAMILLNDEKKVPLQVLLKKLIVERDIDQEFALTNIAIYSQETIIYATIVISIIPIIIAYPFLQKYFSQGAIVGSIKE